MSVPFWLSDRFIHYLNLEGAYFVLFTKIRRMKKGNFLLTGILAMLTVLMMVGCMGDADPVRVSLDIDASDLVLTIGETSTRMGSSKATDGHFTYRTDNPSVATVDKDGEVTARSIGEATITVHMDENRTDWYAATDRTYRVVVKAPSAEKLRQYDRDTPLTLVALEDGKITITFNNGITLDDDIVYTINDGDEKIISKDTKGAYDIVVKKNDFVQLFSYSDALSSGIAAGARGTTRAVADGAKYINIKPAMKTEIYGNVMSMLEGDFFDDDCVIDADFALYGLFAGAEKLVNNPFRHIELPAYELTEGCFQAMFYGCKGLQRAPDLLADELMDYCYKEMFAGCSKLSYVKCYAEDISADDCTKDWLAGAGSEVTDGKTLVTTFKFPANSNDGVPAGWTNELIYPVKSVTLNKTSLEMIAGSAETGTATLTATVAPEYASDKTVFWLTSNEKVATVDDNGKVKAVGSGEAKITATAGGKYASCTVKVTVLVAGITLDKTELDMTIDDEPVTLVAKVTPDGATDKTVTWSSSNEKVATVDANGKVKAVGNGEATITAKAGDKTATCTVKVTVFATGITLDKTNLTMEVVDAPVKLTAKVTPDGAIDGAVTWSSDKTDVATVDANGNVTAVGNGEAKITAKASDYSATCTVKVTNTVTLSKLDRGVKFTVKNGYILTGILGGKCMISIADGATVTFDNVNIVGGIGRSIISKYAGITCEGNATIILVGTNYVKGFHDYYPGIQPAEGKTLTIKGSGSLTAKSEEAPGIGSAYKINCGNINIEGGTISAFGGSDAAGIGSVNLSTCGNITISGGTVDATGGSKGPGIGSGPAAYCGNITITKGVTKVTAKGNNAITSVGFSDKTSHCGKITIGGTVYWDGNNYQNNGEDYLRKSPLVFP